MPDLTGVLYAAPRTVEDLAVCHFYHAIELPGLGLVPGAWDLRRGVRAYLGRADFRGQRVLDVGTASGYLAFTLERWGAEVVAHDLSPAEDWDLAPGPGVDLPAHLEHRREHQQRLNNAFWLCHRRLGSRVRLVHGTIYALPPALGTFDSAVLGCVLLHLRDPFLGLTRVAALVRRQLVVVEPLSWGQLLLGRWLDWLRPPRQTLLPTGRGARPADSWWRLSPALVRRFLALLGFPRQQVGVHWQRYRGRPVPLFTVVGERAGGAAQ